MEESNEAPCISLLGLLSQNSTDSMALTFISYGTGGWEVQVQDATDLVPGESSFSDLKMLIVLLGKQFSGVSSSF